MAGELSYEQSTAMDQALDVLAIESRAIEKSPDFGGPQHDALPFPSNALTAAAWDSGWVHK